MQGLLADLKGWINLLPHYTDMVKTVLFSVVRDTKGHAAWLGQSQWGLPPLPERPKNYRDERCNVKSRVGHSSHLEPLWDIYPCHYTMVMGEHALTNSK